MGKLYRRHNGRSIRFDGPDVTTNFGRKTVTCPTCFCVANEAWVVVTATHRTAYCVRCGHYVKHLSAQEAEAPKPSRATGERRYAGSEPLTVFWIVTATRTVGVGSETIVLDCFDKDADSEYLHRPAVAGVTISREPAIAGKPPIEKP